MYGPPPPGYNQPPIYNQPPSFNQPPGYYNQPPPPQTIIINNSNQNEPTITNMCQMGKISKCGYCNKETDNVMRTKIGGVTIAWCCFLMITTGFLFWIPCCVDSCKDTEVVCQQCTLVKTTIPANCC